MSNNILKNINNIILSSNLFEELTLDDLENVYNDYSDGIDYIASKVYDIYKDSPLIRDLPDKFPKNVKSNGMYRGATNRGSFMKMNPKIRKSRDTSNIYTLLMSEILPSWEKYPKRNNSVIFTNDYHNASRYAPTTKQLVYNVIPPNDATMVISKSSDVWNAFTKLSKKNIRGLPEFNRVISILMGIFYYFMDNNYTDHEIISVLTQKSNFYETMNNVSVTTNKFEKIDNLFNNRKLDEIYKIFNFMDNFKQKNKNYLPNLVDMVDFYSIKYMPLELLEYVISNYINSTTFIKTLDSMLDPENNGFKLMKYSDYNDTHSNECEIWTSSPCIQLDSKFYNKPKFLRKYLEIIAV